VFIDVGSVGTGVCDRLVEMGYGSIMRGVNFGSAHMEPPRLDPHGKPSGGPANRRAEMWMKSEEWLEDVAVQLESKDAMRARGVPSPDEWDAVAFTFAEIA
jgi:hypothetical protein